MSMEQAILEHAAAIRELAAALTQRSAPLTALANQAESTIKMVEQTLTGGNRILTGDSEVEKDVQKVDAEAKKEIAGKADPKPDASGAAEQADTKAGAQPSDAKPLDYLKDVAPTLNKLAKANRDGLVALFAKYGAKKGAELKAEDYASVLGEATELLGAAG